MAKKFNNGWMLNGKEKDYNRYHKKRGRLKRKRWPLSFFVGMYRFLYQGAGSWRIFVADGGLWGRGL